MSMDRRIERARIEWRDGLPISTEFDDIYFSSEDGRQETAHVFFQGNNLEKRFASLETGGAFFVGELGFGSGQNFFLLLETFLRIAPPRSTLHFFSCELYPFSREDMRRFYEIHGGADPDHPFFQSYGRFAPGRQRFLFAEGGRVSLDIHFGDVLEFLQGLEGRMDAWFLDGFAPAKNPHMWNPDVFSHMARASGPGTTVSTFSAAGVVKRGLESAGFTVEKVPGYGRKREMIRAIMADDTGARTNHPATTEANHQRNLSQGKGGEPTVTIVGGGVAGVSAAFAFARRGLPVRLLEEQSELALRSSGNPAGVIFPFLNAIPTPMSRFLIHGFSYVKHLIAWLETEGIPVKKRETGVIQLAHEERQAKRFEQALENLGYDPEIVRSVDQGEILRLCGFESTRSGVFFGEGFWVRPPDLVRGLAKLAGDNLEIITGVKVSDIKRSESDGWTLYDQNSSPISRSPLVVVAAGYESLQFSHLQSLPIRRNRGQIALVQETTISEALRAVVCYDGYVIPSVDGVHVVGADYDRGRFDLEVDPEVNRTLIKNLENYLPDLVFPGDDMGDGRCGIRAMGMDHLPLVGHVHSANEVAGGFEKIPGLFVSAGHGSRGLSYAPAGGELIAALALGEPLPVPADLARSLSPERFLIRNKKRGESS